MGEDQNWMKKKDNDVGYDDWAIMHDSMNEEWKRYEPRIHAKSSHQGYTEEPLLLPHGASACNTLLPRNSVLMLHMLFSFLI